MGDSYQSLKQYPQAIEHYQQALAIYRELKQRAAEADVLNRMGVVYDNLKQYQQALESYQQAFSNSAGTQEPSTGSYYSPQYRSFVRGTAKLF
jgi:tetratricopeptide (TPR) repeat protein